MLPIPIWKSLENSQFWKKKSLFFNQSFFSTSSILWSRCWNRKLINRPNRGYPTVESSAITRASSDNTVRLDQSNRSLPNWQLPSNRPDILFACLFHLFNKQNKLNLLVSLIFLATTRLYITILKEKNIQMCSNS